MYRATNCRNSNLLIFLLIFPAILCAGKANFVVDPVGTKATAPSVRVSAEEGEEWHAYFWKLENSALKELITSSTQTATSVPLEFRLPATEADTYVEVVVTTSTDAKTTSAFRWRSLARPKDKKLIDYKGTDQLLPPDDFDEYWERAVSELDKVTSNPRVTRVPDQDTTTGLLYRVELDSVENTTIVSWCYIPREAYAGGNPDAEVVRKFPAVILIPGYNGEQKPVDRTKDGYITFSTNPRNHGPSKVYWKSPVEHQLYNITKHNDYYYKLAALDCLQAARFVFSRKEVDTKFVGTEGSSQGGYLSAATAMLEPRIACVVANVIAFTDYADGMELSTKGGFTRMRTLLQDEESSASLINQSLSYTDGANLMSRVKSPVQITMGGMDANCPYICGIVAYNRLDKGVEKDFAVDPMTAHKVTKFMRQRTAEWQARWLKPSEDKSGE